MDASKLRNIKMNHYQTPASLKHFLVFCLVTLWTVALWIIMIGKIVYEPDDYFNYLTNWYA